MSFIVPSYWTENQHADALRKYLLDETKICEIVEFNSLPVFTTASGRSINVDTMTFRAIRAGNKSTDFEISVYKPDEKIKKEKLKSAESFLTAVRSSWGQDAKIKVRQSYLGSGKWTFSDKNIVLSRLKKDGTVILPLGDISEKEILAFPSEFTVNKPGGMHGICLIGQGQETGLSEVFTLEEETIERLGLEADLLKPVVKNSHINRWTVSKSNKKVIMTQDFHDIDNYPNIKAYLSGFRDLLEKRQRVEKGVRKWYSVSIPQNYEIFKENPKILVPYRSAESRFALDEYGYFNDGGDVRAIVIKPEWRDRITYYYLLALLNSSLIYKWYSLSGKRKGGVFEYFTRPLSRIPVKLPEKDKMKKINENVKLLIKLSSTEKSLQDKKSIKKLESENDAIFSDMYGVRI
mgnify:CR=1 FL=1